MAPRNTGGPARPPALGRLVELAARTAWLWAAAAVGGVGLAAWWGATRPWVGRAASATPPPRCVVSNGSLSIKRYSSVGGGNLLPGFMFMQGKSDGLEQALGVRTGGGRGARHPFVPDDSCDEAIFEGASPDLRSPQLPYLTYDTWGCERAPAVLPAILLDSQELRVTVAPQFGGRVWGMRDKVAGREFFFRSDAHQPANIGARGAWVAGGFEFNWAPGFLGHSVFTEDRVWAAKLATGRGDVLRIYEFDRYNGTVFQVDMLLEGGELWTHTKVTNPNPAAVLGYWWTCAAHEAAPATRIVAPASLVTVATAVGTPLRNAPWPRFDNGMLNSTFGGIGGERLVDSSYLGSIAYTGDYFLRVPPRERKWIAHAAPDGYVAVHGYSLNGTKFFTWGQSGPGRFMQDFLAGGETGGGYYTELQIGVTPTQLQVFTLAANFSLGFTEYFKPLRRTAPLPPDYSEAAEEVRRWWDSSGGVPTSKVADIDAFFTSIQDRPVQRQEIISEGSNWGALQELLVGRALAPGANFFLVDSPEAALWTELAQTGGFSAATLSSIRAPGHWVDGHWVAGHWVARLEESARRHNTWLHDVLLAVAYAEAGEVDRPRRLLEAALRVCDSPIAARTLAVLSSTAEEAWSHFSRAWDLSMKQPPPDEGEDVTHRLRRNLADENLHFILGHLPGAATGRVDTSDQWFHRLAQMTAAAQVAVGAGASDTILLARAIVDAALGRYGRAMGLLAAECFPTLGRGRDVLVSLWKACAEGAAARGKGSALTPAEAHRARKASPVPRNIGCPYATLYCDGYW